MTTRQTPRTLASTACTTAPAAHAQTTRARFVAAIASLALAIACCCTLAGCSGAATTAANDGSSPARPPAEALEALPEYSGLSYIEVNGNVPYFSGEADLPNGYEVYTPLDLLGRCGTAEANVSKDTMPTGERGDISEIHPSGWDQEFYDFVENEALYNRSHLIGFQLAGENANEANLITGTRHMNADIMEPLESEVAQYVRRTGNHVRYRVTPVFVDEELVARGVLMEAESVEDDGEGIRFCVYAYNVQPGVDINYETGANWANGQSTQVDFLDARQVNGDVPAEVIAPASSTPASGDANAEGSTASDGASDGAGSSSGTSDATNDAPGSTAPNTGAASSTNAGNGSEGNSSASAEGANAIVRDYVLNTGSRKFHTPDCPSCEDISGNNRQDYHGTRDDLIARGYEPCGACRP